MWRLLGDGGTLILQIPISKQRNTRNMRKKSGEPDWPEGLDW